PGAVWHWIPLTDSLPAQSSTGNIAAGGLAMDAGDPETLYLALGDPFQVGTARGIWVTHDGGASWTAGGFAGPATAVCAVVAHAPGVVLVGGDAQLWRSTDGGASFANIWAGPGPIVYSFARFADGTLIASGGSGQPRDLDTRI